MAPAGSVSWSPPDRRPIHNSQPVRDCGLNRQVDLVRFHKRPACEISLKHRHRMPILRDTHNSVGAPAQFQPMTNTVLRTLALSKRTRQYHYTTRSMPLLGGPCAPLNNSNAKNTEHFGRCESRTQPCAGGSRPGERHRPARHGGLLPRPPWPRSAFASGQVSACPGSGEPLRRASGRASRYGRNNAELRPGAGSDDAWRTMESITIVIPTPHPA